MHLAETIKNLWTEDDGQDVMEYALIAALVGIAVVSAMRVLNTTLTSAFNNLGNSVTTATGTSGTASH